MRCRNLFPSNLFAIVTLVASALFLTGSAAAQQAGSARRNSQWADDRVGTVQREFPNANIRVTGRERTERRQAELMYDRARANREDLLNTYRNAGYAQQMDQWLRNNPNATREQAVSQFESYINQARRQGARVSNHLPSPNGNVVARDISIPSGGAGVQRQVEQRINELGGSVLREDAAPTGPHWHVQFNRNAGQPASTSGGQLIFDENAPRVDSSSVKPRQSGESAATASLRF
jgi:hypothetical protein